MRSASSLGTCWRGRPRPKRSVPLKPRHVPKNSQPSDRKQPSALVRGREFEALERAGWTEHSGDELRFEKQIVDPSGKRGRVDVFVGRPAGRARPSPALDPGVGIGEIKATDWDQIDTSRIRPLALRHARQAWRYIESQLAMGESVCAAIIYPKAPKSAAKKELVEAALDTRGVQCVWRED